jgi:hypothetical protein
LDARFETKLIQSVAETPGGLIGLVVCHDVIGVQDGHDARYERNRLLLEPVGIPLAIPPFMVIQKDIGKVGELSGRICNAVSDFDMLFYQKPFRLVEPVFFRTTLSGMPILPMSCIRTA